MKHPATRSAPFGCLWQRGDRRHRGVSPLRHEELVVLMGLSGQGRYLLDGAEMRLHPGTLLWAPPGSAHMLVAAADDFDMWVFLAHPQMWPDGMPAVLGQTSGHRILAPDVAAGLAGLARDIAAAPATARGYGLCWWLWQAYTHWQAADRIGAQRWHPAVVQVAQTVARAPDQPLSVHCGNVGLSRAHLGRLFRKQTGQTLGQFRSLHQLEMVDRLVARGRSLLNAAFDAGFGSYAQFFRVFRAIRGQTPRAYYAKG